MMRIEADICVIGAGAGGLSVAAGAAQLGARTVLIERGDMGGDCLNNGCIPSKALLAAAKAASQWRDAKRFGVSFTPPAIDFPAVMRHVHQVIAAIAPNDSVERFEGLGVRVLRGEGRFVGPRDVVVGETVVRAKRLVVATGSHPLVPLIDGIDRVRLFTNETIFDNRELPRHLLVIGGGPIGVEMAQAHHRLGAGVTVLEMARILPKDDRELTSILAERLRGEGIALCEQASIMRVEPTTDGVAIVLQTDGREKRVVGSHLLVAAGRRPVVEHLDLKQAGIAYGPKGIEVDARLRTTNRRVFAIGDVAAGPQFTHVASYHAGIVIRNALFRLPAKVDYRALPWVTYTDPELAHVGLTEEAARGTHGAVTILRWPYAENDRAQTERQTHGLIKVVATTNGQILGASIVGAHAGELINAWGLAISSRLTVKSIAGMMAPYPTLGEIGKRAAGNFYAPKLFSERTKKIVRFLQFI